MSMDVTDRRTASLTERVAEEIRALMARRQLRQSHLARQLGVSEQWVSVRLRGVQPIDLNDLQRIAEALDIPVVDLLPASARKGRSDMAPYLSTPDRTSKPQRRPADTRPTARPTPSRPLAITRPDTTRPGDQRPPNRTALLPRAARRKAA